MSTAHPEPAAAAGAAAPNGKKKMIIIIVAAVLLVVLAGGGAVVAMKMKNKKHADDESTEQVEEEEQAEPEAPSKDHKAAPVFLPLDPFVVNLADKDADRFAQIAVTLEVDTTKFAEDLKANMPAIRNGVLMVLAHKTAAELLRREGKEALAKEIMREVLAPMGIELEEEEPAEEEKSSKKKKKKKRPAYNPVTHVYFSNFIIQ